jgi:hypothetical protein
MASAWRRPDRLTGWPDRAGLRCSPLEALIRRIEFITLSTPSEPNSPSDRSIASMEREAFRHDSGRAFDQEMRAFGD